MQTMNPCVVTALWMILSFASAAAQDAPATSPPGPMTSDVPALGIYQLAGEDQPAIVVEQQLADFAEQLTREVMAKRLEAAMAPSEP